MTSPCSIFHGKNVAVIGGGNTALDAIRSALRLGASKAYVIYRRSEAEMPARKEEVKHAQQEGIEFHVLTNSHRISVGRQGLAERSALHAHGTGRSRRVRTQAPGAGSRDRSSKLPLSVAVIAIGTGANPLIQSTTPGLNTNKRNYIEADVTTQRTSRRGVFAGGDIVTGSATVILAMGAGRRAAKSIHEYLTSGEW